MYTHFWFTCPLNVSYPDKVFPWQRIFMYKLNRTSFDSGPFTFYLVFFFVLLLQIYFLTFSIVETHFFCRSHFIQNFRGKDFSNLVHKDTKQRITRKNRKKEDKLKWTGLNIYSFLSALLFISKFYVDYGCGHNEIQCFNAQCAMCMLKFEYQPNNYIGGWTLLFSLFAARFRHFFSLAFESSS